MDASESEITIKVDGQDVSLNEFAGSVISAAIIAMVGELKGADDPKEIEIIIRQD